MVPMPYVADRASVDIATALIADRGEDAGAQAALHADQSRTIGNVLSFCRWRQIERLILILQAQKAVTTLH
jgi:hypothetical protein